MHYKQFSRRIQYPYLSTTILGLAEDASDDDVEVETDGDNKAETDDDVVKESETVVVQLNKLNRTN